MNPPQLVSLLGVLSLGIFFVLVGRRYRGLMMVTVALRSFFCLYESMKVLVRESLVLSVICQVVLMSESSLFF